MCSYARDADLLTLPFLSHSFKSRMNVLSFSDFAATQLFSVNRPSRAHLHGPIHYKPSCGIFAKNDFGSYHHCHTSLD